MSNTSVPTLGYFNIRGRAQPIRLMLAYAGVKYNEKDYDRPGAEDMEAFKVDWFKEKFTLGFDFPNLPYYIDGGKKLTHTKAIMRHLARKHGLVATDETGLERQDMVEEQMSDILTEFFMGVLFTPTFETAKVKYIAETLPKQLEALSQFLGTRQWFTGNSITYVDFGVYETLDWFRILSPETVNKYQNLVQLLTRFESLPAIKAYMKSPEFISWPLLSPMCAWGWKK